MEQQSTVMVPMMPVMPVTQMVQQRPGDVRRHPTCQPGRWIYSANIDDDKVKCYYCWHLNCCATTAIQRTFVDVYSNSVVVNAPRACCCGLCFCDNVTTVFFDDPLMSDPPIKGECCTPCCHCCPHCCNCCGETLVFQRSCWCPRGFGHWSAVGPCFCRPIDVIAGLPPGEGTMLAAQIAGAIAMFRNPVYSAAVMPPVMISSPAMVTVMQ